VGLVYRSVYKGFPKFAGDRVAVEVNVILEGCFQGSVAHHCFQDDRVDSQGPAGCSGSAQVVGSDVLVL